MAITLDEIAIKAIPIPLEVYEECECTGRLAAYMEKRKALKLLIMQWYEQETTTAHKVEIPQAGIC